MTAHTPTRPALPDFTAPPLIEVALSAQFGQLPGFRSHHAGVLWGLYGREGYTDIEETPALGHIEERFGAVKLVPDQDVQVEVVLAPPPPRYLFKDDKQGRLVQVQADRFGHNWRKTLESDTYPRYESVREGFAKQFGVFSRFVADQKLGEIGFDQCEVTYVNHIFADEGVPKFTDVFSIVGRPQATFLPEPEDQRLAMSFVMTGPDAEPVGRLRVAANPALILADGRPVIVMKCVARGKPTTPDPAGVLAFFDLGREWIVRGFTDLTTPTMHRKWGRTK